MTYPSISDYLYSLRDEAGIAAERLKGQIADANAVLAKLESIADGAQDAAELVAASDLEPNAVATIPARSGLMARCTAPDQHEPPHICELPEGHDGPHVTHQN